MDEYIGFSLNFDWESFAVGCLVVIFILLKGLNS